MANRPALWAFGPTPPPVTGMTLLTQRVLQAFQQVGPLVHLNWSPGGPGHQLRFRAKRIVRTLACLAKLAARGRVQNAPLYVVANSQGGLLLTALLLRWSRWLGYHVYLHHHTYYYIDQKDGRMASIDQAFSPHDSHIVHCQQMADDFRAVYGSPHRFEYVLPSILVEPWAAPRSAARVPFRLGYLSNLTIAKGLDLVLETFTRLSDQGRDVRLIIAGPLHDRKAEQMLTEFRNGAAGRIQYLGPIYGSAKAEFFDSIDCFVFPSRSESWGLVLNEALAAAVPVIASARGCVPTLVGSAAGLVVPPADDFATAAGGEIDRWIRDPDAYRSASAAAVRQATCLYEQGAAQLENFAKRLYASGARCD